MRKWIAINLIEFVMSIFENSEEKWDRIDYERYANLQDKLKQVKIKKQKRREN